VNSATKPRQHLALAFGSAEQNPDGFLDTLFSGREIKPASGRNAQWELPANAEKASREIGALTVSLRRHEKVLL
jgi:hypothetical protein